MRGEFTQEEFTGVQSVTASLQGADWQKHLMTQSNPDRATRKKLDTLKELFDGGMTLQEFNIMAKKRPEFYEPLRPTFEGWWHAGRIKAASKRVGTGITLVEDLKAIDPKMKLEFRDETASKIGGANPPGYYLNLGSLLKLLVKADKPSASGEAKAKKKLKTFLGGIT
jgi:hypothetical protein